MTLSPESVQGPVTTLQVTEDLRGKTEGCLLCGGILTVLLPGVTDNRFGIGGSYDVFRCTACGFEQTYPIPSPDELKALYERYYNFGGERDTAYTRIREWFHFSPAYRLWLILDGDISFHRPKGAGRLLDIGCNEGRGLKIYSRNGFQAEGLELNETAARVARGGGFIVHTCPLQEFQPSHLYDVVVLSNVLEHSLNPREMLADVRRILKGDGQVWISCPNNQSWQRKVLGRNWANWHVPFHIVHFSPYTLKRVLIDSGFTKVEISQITPALWVASNLIVSVFARPNRITKELRNALLVMLLMLFVRGLLFPILWLGDLFGRGDCLVVMARKT
jgi:SAM-dependent methyltransferase